MTDTQWLIELADWLSEDKETAQRLTAIAIKVGAYDNLELVVHEDGQFAYRGRMVQT